MREALTWYLVVQVTALAVWPIVWRALAPLEDRGWAASKTAGLLGVAWLAWLVCMLAPVPFVRGTLVAIVLIVGGLAWGLLVRRGELDEMRAWLRAQQRLLAIWELVLLAAFALFATLRSREPAIAFTEKPMDMAFFNGFVAAQSLPTQDTWLAGFGVPYYYFGYFVLACLDKLAGTDPGIGYNLAAALVPALACVGLASLAWSLARASGVRATWAATGSLLAVALGLFCGNLGTFFEWLVSRGWLGAQAGATLGIKGFADGVVVGVWPPANPAWWFHASRVIPNIEPDGIDEFPFFSAFLSDLHPHFVALPFELLVVALGVVHVLSRGATLRSAWTQGAAAVALGALLVMNTWDIAPFWLLYVGLSLLGAWGCQWRWRWAAASLTPIGGALLYAPYFVGYGGPPLGLGIVEDRMRTHLNSFLVLFAWAVVLLAGLGLFVRWCLGDRRGWLLSGAGAALGLALAILGQPVLGLLVALVALLLPWPGVLAGAPTGAAAATVGIGGFAAVMLLGVELIFLDDVFHTRMNTVFKFHENAWLLAALAGGVGVALVGHFTRRAGWLVLACAVALTLAGLVYPVSAIMTRMSERPPGGPTLDGMQFLSPDERAGIRWLSEQNGPNGRVVVAEAVGGEYSSGARMATYSGAASVLGWAGHELQWRGQRPELGQRQFDLERLYRDGSTDEVRSILDHYGVQYVVVGDLERQIYGDGVDTRFVVTLPAAFRSGDLTIFRAH
jgi:YYY domain-containing protein